MHAGVAEVQRVAEVVAVLVVEGADGQGCLEHECRCIVGGLGIIEVDCENLLAVALVVISENVLEIAQ